ALEERLHVAELSSDAVVREDRQIERIVIAERALGLVLELRDVLVEAQLLAEESRRGERETRDEALVRDVTDLRGELVSPRTAAVRKAEAGDVPRLHDPDILFVARELDVPRDVLDRFEAPRNVGERRKVLGRKRGLVGRRDLDLFETSRADDERAMLARDGL